jgi:hypothetical protein
MIDWYWEEVDEFESQGKWYEAKDYMYQKWKRNRQDIKTLIRLGLDRCSRMCLFGWRHKRKSEL